jgi:glycerol-3-phosphate acyltransferase PlsX
MTVRPIRVAVDAMGGDLGPEEVVRGVLQAARERNQSASLILVGNQQVIQSEIARHKPIPDGVKVIHASQCITMNDRPREVYRKKPDASVVVAARLVRDGEADAFISIGNTGAAMAASIYMFRLIPGVDRPAIATPLPSLTGTIVLVDAGANPDCAPRQLLEFAIMGQVYARDVLGIAHPTVGLLSNGAEESKGNTLTKQTHHLLKECMPEFRGNVEGMDVFRGKVDVVVCDGFSGNIVLKVGEGVAEMVLSMVREELTRNRWLKMFLLPFRKGMRQLRSRIDYREFGGAPLLGVNGVCIIGHGRSDAQAIVNAIRVAETAVRNNLVEDIECAIRTVKARPARAMTTVEVTPPM